MTRISKIFIILFLGLGIVQNIFAQIDSAFLKPMNDTLDTEDKYTKILLYDDYTWDFMSFDRPYIDEEDFEDEWTQDNVHAYKGLKLLAMPEEVTICLVDSLHGYVCPYIGRVSSGFGYRRRRVHRGIDIPLTPGDSIRAAFPGKVRVAKTTRHTGGYGNLIVIRHTNGLETYYAHMSKLLVKENELVKEGEVIGLGGNTGRSSGPHLHFEIRYKGKAFDPRRIFDFEIGEIRDTVFVLNKKFFNPRNRYYPKRNNTNYASVKTNNKSSSTEKKYHIISKGDTLTYIATKYNTTVSYLCSLNGISSKKTLRIGQRLRVQ